MDEEIDLSSDRDSIESALTYAGFDDSEVMKAFDWLQVLAESGEDFPVVSDAATAIRVFIPEEEVKLDVESRGFLLFLEQSGVLNPHSRELVIDRVMALEAEDIDIDQLKWVVLMVLFNQPGHEEAFVWMENIVLHEMDQSIH
jgi:Smg protein